MSSNVNQVLKCQSLITDIMIGVLAGVLLKILYIWMRGISVKELVSVKYTLVNGAYTIAGAWVFTNIHSLKRHIVETKQDAITLDISECIYVDHTAHELIYQMKDDLAHRNITLTIIGNHN
jgi:MFS superfamily sulfate permease-like transporter